MQPVKTFYRADDVVVSYHFLTVMRADAMSEGLLPPLIDLIEGDGDEFGRGAGAMAGVGMALSFRSECGPIGVELRFGALPEPGLGQVLVGCPLLRSIQRRGRGVRRPGLRRRVSDPVAGRTRHLPRPHPVVIPPRPLPPDDLDVPYESWSDEDQKNPASEDFWERITITLQSDPDAIVDAAPFQLPPAAEVPATAACHERMS